MIFKILGAFLRTLFPSVCVVCNQPPHVLHLSCARFLPVAPKTKLSHTCACFAYRHTSVRKLIRFFKKHEDADLARTLASTLASEIESKYPELCTLKHLILCPIPASQSRMKKYGFNQSALLAKSLHTQFKNSTYIPDLFLRTREIAKQALLTNRTERLANPKGAFAIQKKYLPVIKNTTVLIVDDIITTGATYTELKRVLLENKAKNVYGAMVGH